MFNLRHAFKFAQSTFGATAVLLSCGSSVMAHAPLKIPLAPIHLVRVPVSPIHAELESILRRSSNAAVHLPPLHLVRVPVSPIHAELENILRRSAIESVPLAPTHLVGVPTHTELANTSRISAAESIHDGILPTSRASGVPFDLSFRDYPEAQHEKLTSIVVLLLHSEKLDKSGDFKRRDQVNAQARQLLYSLGKQTVLKVAKDAQFIQLHVLKHIFQIDP